MSPRRYARHEKEKSVALRNWIPWSSKDYTSEYERGYREPIEILKALVQWAEERIL